MSDGLVLLARLRDAPGALERLLGLLRRRSLPVASMSVYRSGPDVHEVVLRFGVLTTPEARVEAELRSLVDLVSLRRPAAGSRAATREIAIASTRGSVGDWPSVDHGALRDVGAGSVELTGSPAEIDRGLRLMSERGVLAASSRSGELYPPDPTITEP